MNDEFEIQNKKINFKEIGIMKLNQLIIMKRSLLRNRLHSSVNIIGFALGIAVFTLIVVYAWHKMSIDRFHSKHKQIYKIVIGTSDEIPAPIAATFKNHCAYIDEYVRVDNWYGGGQQGYFKTKDNLFKIDNHLLFADSSFFSFFDFKLLQGTPHALKTPNTVILSRYMALKIFGSENPIGKSIEYHSKNSRMSYNFTVGGIIEDAPSNSSEQYCGIVSMITIPSNNIRRGNIEQDWGNWGFSSYIKIAPGRSIDEINNSLQKFWTGFIKERWNVEPDSEMAKDYKLTFVPMADVWFYNNNQRSFIYLILVIGFIILAIAVVNYINLSLALSTTRLKEIGVRKVIGSTRRSMFKQFITESVLMTSIASIIAVVLIFIVSRYFIEETNIKSLIAPDKLIVGILVYISGIIAIGFLSGIYPAIYITSQKAVKAVKNELNKSRSGFSMKHILIVFQFAVSIILVIGVLTISKQVDFVKNKDLGYQYNRIIYFTQSASINKKYEAFRQTLLKQPGIKNVCRVNTHLGRELNITAKHKVDGVFKRYHATTVDADFVETMGLKLIEGRNFSRDIKHDFGKSALVNEIFVEQFDLHPAVGSEIEFLDRKFTVCGVIRNFHNTSLHSAIEPSMFCNLDWNACINVKVDDKNISSAIASIRKVWNEFSPDKPLEYNFLDNTYWELYKSDMEFRLLISLATILAVCIASLGLFGLIAFTSNQRRKEIGIRKINGATISEILGMLNQDITKWVAIAFVIACPVAYYAMTKWLENFAYKTDISWWIFIASGGIALFIALITVSWQSWRAASRNPVEALRYE